MKLTNKKAASILCEFYGRLIIQRRVEINDQELEAFRLAIKTLEECKASQDEEDPWRYALRSITEANI